uniref:Reverse transcriptase domain-containing protein n=1 Tax=Biomphalaria glabrata TaxID=6526 RepID=A0A2C9KVC7_BIOGL
MPEGNEVAQRLRADHWRDACAGLDLRDTSKAWRLLCNLEAKDSVRTATPLLSPSGDRVAAKDQKMAYLLNKYFVSISKSEKKSATSIALNKERKRLDREPDGSEDLVTCNAPFCRAELDGAIAKCKNRKAPGPDKVTPKMVKHLGCIAKDNLLGPIRKLWVESRLPRAWRCATIVPLLKKGKDATNVESYRPISLTSTIGKIVERMVSERLVWSFDSAGILEPEQAGFRAGLSPIDQVSFHAGGGRWVPEVREHICSFYRPKTGL